MSTRNPNNWTVIRDTVHEAQDTLSRICLYGVPYHNERNRAIQYPQTLGELCLDVFRETMSTGQRWWFGGYIGTMKVIRYGNGKETLIYITLSKLTQFRRELYHKNTDDNS